MVLNCSESICVLHELVASVHYTHNTNTGIDGTGILQLIFIYIYKNSLKGRRTG